MGSCHRCSANIALSALDDHFAQGPGGPASSQAERAKRRRLGLPNCRLVRYADDWTMMVAGTRDDAEALREEVAEVLAPMGLRLSPEKTLITHIDEGLDFLGWRIQRHRKRGTDRRYVYTYPSRRALRADRQGQDVVPGNGHEPAAGRPDARLNPLLKGWREYFRPGVSSAHLRVPERLHLAPGGWLDPPQASPDHPEGLPPPLLRRRMVAGRELALFKPAKVTTTRYRYRGSVIPSPWPGAA